MKTTSRRDFMGALVSGVAASAIPMKSIAKEDDNETKGKPLWKDLKPGIYAAIGGYLETCVWDEPTKENHDRIIQTLNSMLRSSWQEGYLYDFKFEIMKHTKTELVVNFGWKEKEDVEFTNTTCTVYNPNYELDGKDMD
jgi:hypothetical protein